MRAFLSSMEFPHSILDDLLARLTEPSGLLYLSQDIDPHALVEKLASRRREPRTLVLDGITDPGVNEAHGACLLDLLQGRGETITAWAHAGQWIGAGAAQDAQGDIVPVLVITPQQVRVLPAGTAGQGEH